jgi:protein-disulfide isomerase
MLKLLIPSLLISSIVSSALLANSSKDLEKFIGRGIKNNPNVKDYEVVVLEKQKLSKPKGWEAFIVEINAKVNVSGKIKKINERSIYFTKDGYLAPDLINMKSSKSLKGRILPAVPKAYYDKKHLLYGNSKSKHKVVIFSDPLCPICGDVVPEILNDLKKSPKTFAVYYYHFPLENLHPASVDLSRALAVLHRKGIKDVDLKAYGIKLDPNEKNRAKILKAVNKKFKTKLKSNDLNQKWISDLEKINQERIKYLMIRGTPTVFLDGLVDSSRLEYLNIKTID